MAWSDAGPPRLSRWQEAAAVLAVVVTVVLAARQWRPLIEAGSFAARPGEWPLVAPHAWPRAAGWTVICVAVLLRRRTVALLGAWTAVLLEIVVVTVGAGDNSGAPLDLIAWPLLLALTATLLVSVSGDAAHPWVLPGRHAYGTLAAAAAVTALTALAIPLLGDHYGPPADPADVGRHVAFDVPSNLARLVAGATFVSVLVLAVASVSGVRRDVAARLYPLVAAGLAGFVVAQLGLPRPFNVWDGPVLSPSAQAVTLVIALSLIAAAGFLWVRSMDRSAHRSTHPAVS
ncbi:hypothetical protein QLQ12_46055 [Actinoplanes sp. NEAU-A12]|uniref:Integral membrane protein n=1 Tax=Actinoplanes sandaracinus TaxID=3045177 RepID=A0ABT6X1S0_9ACTN|nr:hypothetical protein [Actinoplanes sandaracinus]MDI6105959.1 hypothetical protein [Actinoplanes sandaracinus]